METLAWAPGPSYCRPLVAGLPLPKAMHFPARRLKRDPVGYGRILSAVAILMTASCSYCEKRAEKVYVFPGIVTAVPNRPFLMSVRLMNNQGHLLDEEKAAEVRWKSSDPPHLTLSTTQGGQTLVTLSGSAAGPITLTASVDGKSGNATIILADPGLSLNMDWATAPHIDKAPPTLVVVDGQTGSEWRSDSVIAFVGGGPLDEFRPSIDLGEVTVFSPGHALQRTSVTWSDDCDHLRMTEGGVAYTGELAVLPSCRERGMTLATATAVTLHIWTLVDAADAAGVVDVQLEDARRKLANGWTGLTLDVAPPGVQVLDGDVTIVLDIRAELGYKCPTDGTYSLKRQLDDSGVGYGPGKLTVVYAKEIVEPSSDGLLVPSSLGGYTCPRDDILGIVVLMPWTEAVGTTLAHELGHAIGPPLGHTNSLDGFDYSNLMWEYELAVPASREILTLGQSFGLSLDADAFLPQSVVPPPNPTCKEQNEFAETPCPRLLKDVIKK